MSNHKNKKAHTLRFAGKEEPLARSCEAEPVQSRCSSHLAILWMSTPLVRSYSGAVHDIALRSHSDSLTSRAGRSSPPIEVEDLGLVLENQPGEDIPNECSRNYIRGVVATKIYSGYTYGCRRRVEGDGEMRVPGGKD